MATLKIKSSRGSYPVVIESGVLRRLEAQVRAHLGSGRLFVIYDANLFALHGGRIERAFGKVRQRAVGLVIPSGERHKNATTLSGLYDFLLENRIARDDFILACGGGVTSDLTGYAAATILRGVKWGVVTTTVIGMADAAIGGKTGINHPTGKNLIGAFWAPSFVLADTDFLSTLPARHQTAGLGEIMKCAGLRGGTDIARCHRFLDLATTEPKDWAPLIRQAADCKAAIVANDERETGRRVLLNFGHTFGHAIEKAAGYGRLLHGEAVILGLLAALELGCEVASPGKRLDRYSELIRRSVRLLPRRRLPADRILEAMALDKKRQDADLRYVLLRGPGRPYLQSGIDRRTVEKALNRMLRFYEAHGGKGDKDSNHPWT